MSSSNTDVLHMCEICDKKSSQKKTLYRHKTDIHNLHTSKPYTIICSICETGLQTYKDLRDHLITIHGMEMIKELESESWKSAKEKEFSWRYVRRPGYSTGKLVKSYYLYHRSGSAKALDEENRRRRLKSKGFCKMGSSCPSTIEVSYYTDSGTYECELFTPHMHKSNLAHIHLTSNEKSEIANKLAMGVAVNHQADSLFSYAAAAATSTTTIQTHQYRNKRLSEKLYLLASIAESGKLEDHATSKLERAVDNALCSNREFVQLPESKLAPTNQNVRKQLRFTATKRKRKSESNLSKRSETEKSHIKAKFDNDVFQYLQ